MNTYAISHSGHFIGGYSVVVEETEELAISLLRKCLEAYGVYDPTIYDVTLIDDSKSRCYVLCNGDY